MNEEDIRKDEKKRIIEQIKGIKKMAEELKYDERILDMIPGFERPKDFEPLRKGAIRGMNIIINILNVQMKTFPEFLKEKKDCKEDEKHGE